jgi:hypothetical protein
MEYILFLEPDNNMKYNLEKNLTTDKELLADTGMILTALV